MRECIKTCVYNKINKKQYYIDITDILSVSFWY